MKKPIMVQARTFIDSVKKAAFVLGTALIIFAAARNSITWHLQRFWGASGDYWQHLWQLFYSWTDEDHWMIGFWGTVIVPFCAYWIFNAFFTFIDVTHSPKFLLKYKIQEDKNVSIEKCKLMKVILVVLFNQLAVGMAVVYVGWYVMRWRGVSMTPEELPTFHWVLFEMIIFSLVEEGIFYYSHRLLHFPRIYRHIHKLHHEWTAPISLTSIYAHPIEHVLSNLLPVMMGPLLMGSHIATMWLWFALAILSTTIAHCGYHLPLLPSPEAHDYHHLKFNNNFGVLGVLDRLHGTDNNFRASKAYQRHFLLLSMVPVSRQFPDNGKKQDVPEKEF